MRQLAAALLAVLCSASFATAQSKPDRLTKFLQSYLGEPYPPFEKQGATRYSSAFVDLKDDGTKEVDCLCQRPSVVWDWRLQHADLGSRKHVLQGRHENHNHAASNPRVNHEIKWLA